MEEIMAYSKNIFSIPVSRKRQTSMKRRFIVFSSVLYLLIFAVGSAIFIILMNQIMHKNAGREIIHTVEMERLKLEASMNSEIAIALIMSDSPLIRRHFLNPEDEDMKQFAFEEIARYRRAFAGNNVFWINDIDKKYYFGDEYVYTLDPAKETSKWYNEILNNPVPYRFNIDFDIGIKRNMFWINAPVFDDNHKPAGIVGTGVNLSDFINTIYQNYSGTEELFFFNAAGEITGAKGIVLAENKADITHVLGDTGGEILAVSHGLKNKEIKYFEAKDNRQLIAVGSIQDLDWYITIVRPFTIADSLHTGMTVLFGTMMAVIFLIFIVFNIFIFGMLGPLNRMVKKINQTLSEWDLKTHEGKHNKNEIETLGEFFHLTIIDQLTGIYNRRYFDSSLKKIIKSHSRIGGSSLSVLMIDIDYFKKYNDTYGHVAGDDCLKEVASALSQCVMRDEDFVARYGGEEFAAVLPNTDKDGAKLVAEKMLEKARELNIPHETSGIEDYVTISIGGTTGIVNYLQHGSDYIKHADEALYESKENGRNRYTFLHLV
jgi:diguanylate cyclase (GGDEF)-like protein